ncbi:hypothetical protein ACP26F_11695 [Franconibacter pulveris 1160]|uniref:Uncharacterized protein n=2 Tax=Franconibacter TaxID=1649295 RepID=A0A0J8YE49_9ENTR|nr:MULTISPECIES: hypothetical protein [Franconibacter]KMV35794.1 hypothetical protein ACH50_05590 [Franconibacter pulveris]MCK1968205.1 hypothetical protein [Franconibacter sp. IITDAS19]MEB5922333.1 hypothetical protein [Franconibacter daqui]GGD17693.1 hypothetical protein GCM10011513_13950 [Franconibacter daqui]
MAFLTAQTSRRLTRRIRRAARALLLPRSSNDSTRMLESFIPTGHLYGIDFGNIDPVWYRNR